MMRCMSIACVTLSLAVLSGCGKTDFTPRFAGRIVSHVDAYGSGTGGETALKREGSMRSGYQYGDPARSDWTRSDWTSDIKWQLIGQKGEADLYRVEWRFAFRNTAGSTRVGEVPFDGMKPAIVFSNQWQTVSIEPGMTKKDSQAARHVR